MAEGEPNRFEEGRVAKNGHSAAPAENGVQEEPSFSDEDGFVDDVSDAGESVNRYTWPDRPAQSCLVTCS